MSKLYNVIRAFNPECNDERYGVWENENGKEIHYKEGVDYTFNPKWVIEKFGKPDNIIHEMAVGRPAGCWFEYKGFYSTERIRYKISHLDMDVVEKIESKEA